MIFCLNTAHFNVNFWLLEQHFMVLNVCVCPYLLILLNKDAQRIYKAYHFLMNNLWISGFKKYALQYFENYTVLL